MPLLLLANKQDSPESLSVEEIRNDYEDWQRHKRDSARRNSTYGEESLNEHRRERIASLDVMGVSALEGCASIQFVRPVLHELTPDRFRTGVRAAVDWLFIRVQNSRRRCEDHRAHHICTNNTPSHREENNQT